MPAFSEFTDAELDAEIKRLIDLYPSAKLPLTEEARLDLQRLRDLELESFTRWQAKDERGAIFTPYSPLFVYTTN